MKIPKSKEKLKRPVDKRHALLRIEKENVWIRSLNPQLAETFCSLITRGNPVTVKKTVGVLVWGTYAGKPENTGTIILDQKPDGRFKLVPMDITPNDLMTEVANFIGRKGSVTSKEGQHGLILRGELRSPDKSAETKATAQEPELRVAPAGEKAPAETAKIPKSEEKLKRPADKRHALLRIEKENAWIRSLDRKLGETFCALVTQGDPVIVEKTVGFLIWGTYAGEPENTGTIILDQKPDGRFKLVPMGITPYSLLEQVAHLVGRDGSVTSEEGQHGIIYRGELLDTNGPNEPESGAASAAGTPTVEFENITGTDAINAIKQKVTMEFMDHGVKVRIRGKKADCEKTAKLIVKGRPTVATQQGSKFMIEGNLTKSFLRTGANQEGPDANGVYTRDNGLERTFTAFGENLPAVQAACLTGCKKETMFTIVVDARSDGHIVISSGKRSLS